MNYMVFIIQFLHKKLNKPTHWNYNQKVIKMELNYLRCNGITRFGVQCMRHHWTYSVKFNCGVHRTSNIVYEYCINEERAKEIEALKSELQRRDSELAREQAIKCKLDDDLKISECVVGQLKEQLKVAEESVHEREHDLETEVHRRQECEAQIESQKKQLEENVNNIEARAQMFLFVSRNCDELRASVDERDATIRSMQTQFDEKIGQSKNFITKLIEQNKKYELEIAQLKMDAMKAKFAAKMREASE
jgi:chromosome segregation ATPase